MVERRGGVEMWWRGEGRGDVVERRGGGEMWWRGEGEVRRCGEERGS